ncbi:hypothetical protein BIV24_13035 [Streptomyces colonosanans]|uniref:GNAT family N-acetyltransferase n=1 Tax=Streptomyces colonosanans TaxID=1428652 RepID=A0A1S2PFY8_9ACTN|nr:hypothetical protein BIV24_13035 [Streptomyces colonosanans]
MPGARKITVESWTRFTGRLRLYAQDIDVGVRVERCAAGRLRDAYPAGAHDLEVRIDGGCPQDTLAELLGTLVDAVRTADPHCRRIVYAVAEDDRETRAAVAAAGFRHAVDVDLGRQQLSLLVAEPEWVTATDMDLDHVPGS